MLFTTQTHHLRPLDFPRRTNCTTRARPRIGRFQKNSSSQGTPGTPSPTTPTKMPRKLIGDPTPHCASRCTRLRRSRRAATSSAIPLELGRVQQQRPALIFPSTPKITKISLPCSFGKLEREGKRSLRVPSSLWTGVRRRRPQRLRTRRKTAVRPFEVLSRYKIPKTTAVMRLELGRVSPRVTRSYVHFFCKRR